MMSRSDIRTEVLDLLDEETHGRFGLSATNRHINRAYKDLVRYIQNMGRHNYLTSTTITTTASTETVSIPSNCRQILQIYDSDYNRLRKGNKLDFNAVDTGEPSYYDFYAHGTICFDVVPDSTYTYTVEYIYEPDDFSSDTDEPDVPIGGDAIIAQMAAYKMLLSIGDEVSTEFYRRMKDDRDEYLAMVARGYVGGPEKIRRGDRNYGINDWR